MYISQKKENVYICLRLGDALFYFSYAEQLPVIFIDLVCRVKFRNWQEKMVLLNQMRKGILITKNITQYYFRYKDFIVVSSSISGSACQFVQVF